MIIENVGCSVHHRQTMVYKLKFIGLHRGSPEPHRNCQIWTGYMGLHSSTDLDFINQCLLMFFKSQEYKNKVLVKCGQWP